MEKEVVIESKKLKWWGNKVNFGIGYTDKMEYN